MTDVKPAELTQISETRASILTHLLSEELTAVDLEDRLDINESAIRRHLDTLERIGYAEHYFEKAERGRPKKLYKITPEGKGLFPKRTHELFVLLAEKIKERHGEEELEEILSGIADRFAEKLSIEDLKGSEETQLKKFVNSLEEFGFYPLLSQVEGAYYITYRNCVFGKVSEEFSGELCKMHRDIVRGAMPGYDVCQEKGRIDGDKICVHRIEPEVN